MCIRDRYTMAVDRGNGKVAYLYSPLNPSVLRSIRSVIRAGHEAGIPVGMCGESAADSRLSLIHIYSSLRSGSRL